MARQHLAARRHRSPALTFTLAAAAWCFWATGCRTERAHAGSEPVAALISDAPVAAGDAPAHGEQSGRVVAAPSRITDFAPADSSVTVDASTVNLRRIFEDLGDDATMWYQHVETLANPFFEGRAPETRGKAIAAEYVEFYFRQDGLQPGFGSQFTQPFTYTRQGSTTVKVNVAELSISGHRLHAGRDYAVLGNSGDGELTAPVTFVGYAIEAGPDDYASFDAGTDLTGRAALMFRYTPVNADGKPLWDERQATWQGSLRRKMRAVAEHDAAAIIMVNPPGAADSPAGLESADGRFGPALKIPVVQVTPRIADAILMDGDREGRDLSEWRRLADTGRITTANLSDDVQVTFNTGVTRTRDSSELSGTNVAGILRGRGALADQYVVVGAHYDHVGTGTYGGIQPANRGKLHPGADDNASGAAGVLVLGKMLVDGYKAAPRNMDLRSILFITFDGEEMGLQGSRAFTADPPIGPETMTLMLNMDMIGRLRSHNLSVLGTGTAEGLPELLRPHFERSGLTVSVNPAGSGRSDDANFHANKVPAIHFFTGMHPEYTSPADQAYTMNPAGAAEILDLMFEIIYDVASRPQKLVYQEPPPSRGQNRGYGPVRLGIRPGMGEDVESGVVVAGVSTGTSAEEGGILPGDVIIGWNDGEITGMRDLFERLQDHKPGDTVKITVLREGEKVVLDVTLKGS